MGKISAPQTNRRDRLALISDLLGRHTVGRQSELQRLLAGSGVEVSRSTLSRDLGRLGAHRVRAADGSMAYVLPAAPPSATSERSFSARLASSVTAVRRSGFVLLVLTPPGEAQLVGRLLDQAALPGLLGTVAGDDTVIAIAADAKAAGRLQDRLQDMIRSRRPTGVVSVGSGRKEG